MKTRRPSLFLALGLAPLCLIVGSTAARADNTQGITDTTIPRMHLAC